MIQYLAVPASPVAFAAAQPHQAFSPPAAAAFFQDHETGDTMQIDNQHQHSVVHMHIPAAAAPEPIAEAMVAPEALLDAVNEGRIDTVRALIRQDPMLANHRDGFGQTPLMWAAYKGSASMVNCLLDCGALINECETRRARTALYLACEFDHTNVVALLLRRGADQRLSAQRGWTVLSRGFEGWNPLIIAGYNGCPTVLKCLLMHGGADTDAVDEHGATALWWAAVHNRPEAVQVLLEAGADFARPNHSGKTPAEAARERGNLHCTLLLESAARAYIMTRARRLTRESARLAQMANRLVQAAPTYLRPRIARSLAVLPELKRSPDLALMELSEQVEVDLTRVHEGKTWQQVNAVNGKIGPLRSTTSLPIHGTRVRREMKICDAGDEELHHHVLPALSWYITGQMRFDVFVQLRDLLTT